MRNFVKDMGYAGLAVIIFTAFGFGLEAGTSWLAGVENPLQAGLVSGLVFFGIGCATVVLVSIGAGILNAAILIKYFVLPQRRRQPAPVRTTMPDSSRRPC